MSAKDVAGFLMFVGMVGLVAWVMYLFVDARKRQGRLKAQADLNGRLLDKFASARDIVEFLQTPGGAQLMESFSGDRESPSRGVLRSTHRGIILGVLAMGCLALAWHYRGSENPLLVIGVVLLSLGIGFLISAAVARHLSKTLEP